METIGNIGVLVAVVLFATGNAWLGAMMFVATVIAICLWAVFGPIPE